MSIDQARCDFCGELPVIEDYSPRGVRVSCHCLRVIGRDEKSAVAEYEERQRKP